MTENAQNAQRKHSFKPGHKAPVIFFEKYFILGIDFYIFVVYYYLIPNNTSTTQEDKKMSKAYKRCIELVKAEQFKEAFEYGYENGVLLEEDWEEIDGVEYYTVTVEDELFRFEME